MTVSLALQLPSPASRAALSLKLSINLHHALYSWVFFNFSLVHYPEKICCTTHYLLEITDEKLIIGRICHKEYPPIIEHPPCWW